MAFLIALGPVRLPLLVLTVVLGTMSFVMYGVDKAAARRRGRRIPEMTLHLVAVAGGWPGALIGQMVFRHKTRKTSFQVVFWCTVLVNCIAVSWLLGVVHAPRG